MSPWWETGQTDLDAFAAEVFAARPRVGGLERAFQEAGWPDAADAIVERLAVEGPRRAFGHSRGVGDFALARVGDAFRKHLLRRAYELELAALRRKYGL